MHPITDAAASSLRHRVSSRWRKFADDTSIHGMKWLSSGSTVVDAIVRGWIFVSCIGFLCYQAYHLAINCASEKTTTDITTLPVPYPPPRVLIAIPTHLLFRPQRQAEHKDTPDFGNDTLLYIKEALQLRRESISGVGFDASREKLRFEDYLTNYNVTWAQAIEPYVIDIEPWLMASQGLSGYSPLHVSRRLVWYPFTYYLIEPKAHQSVTLNVSTTAQGVKDQTFLMMLAWERSPLSDQRHVILTSFEMDADNFKLEEGGKYKFLFTITGKIHLNLRRYPCRNGQDFHYTVYDYLECKESCYLKAIADSYPSVCFEPVDVKDSLVDLYPRGRPCWRDPAKVTQYSGSWGRSPFRLRDLLRSDPPKKSIDELTSHCVDQRCHQHCNSLRVHYQLNTGLMAGDEPLNRTFLTLHWPSPDGVTILKEKPVHTMERVIGQMGGLMGLWLGASVISFFEMLYYCLFCCFDIAEERVDQEPEKDVISNRVESTRF